MVAVLRKQLHRQTNVTVGRRLECAEKGHVISIFTHIRELPSVSVVASAILGNAPSLRPESGHTIGREVGKNKTGQREPFRYDSGAAALSNGAPHNRLACVLAQGRYCRPARQEDAFVGFGL